jgi:hypothetical protein
VAIDYPYNLTSPRRACQVAGAEPIATYDDLTSAERRVLTDLNAKALFEPDEVTAKDQRIADELGPESFVVTVFRWRDVCAPPP